MDRKIFRIPAALITGLALVFACLYSSGFTKVFASTAGTYTFTVNKSDSANFDNGGVSFKFDNSTQTSTYLGIAQSNNYTNTETASMPQDASHLTIKVTDAGQGIGNVSIRANGQPVNVDDYNAFTSQSGYILDLPQNGNVEITITIGAVQQNQGNDPNQGGNPNQGNDPGPNHQLFDTAYIVWQGPSDEVFFYRITGLDASPTGNGSYDIVYIPSSQIIAEGTGEGGVEAQVLDLHYAIDSGNYYFVKENQMGTVVQYTSFAELKDYIESLDEDAKRDFAFDPTGAQNGNSTLCTNGDRSFRLTIYDETSYEGVAFSANESDYTYFPDFWDNTFFSNTVDVSGTSADNPAEKEMFMLEPNLRFETAQGSIAPILSVTPIGVPSGAVNVSGDSGSGFTVTFASNFYDNVVFKLSSAKGDFYLKINRVAMVCYDMFRPNVPLSESPYGVRLYYASNDSYSNYDVYANIHYENGTSEMKKLEVVESLDINEEPTGSYEMDAGKGLKSARYELIDPTNVVTVDYNAVKAGAFSGNTYKGTYAGSGDGVTYEMKSRRTIY